MKPHKQIDFSLARSTTDIHSLSCINVQLTSSLSEFVHVITKFTVNHWQRHSYQVSVICIASLLSPSC